MNYRSSADTSIRPDVPGDHEAVSHLIVAAFTESQHGHNGEADLVDRLRTNRKDVTSLVAVSDVGIIGHVLFSPVQIQTSDTSIVGSGLAPIAVLPSHQKTGIGSALIHAGIKQLRTANCPFIVLIGDPKYYSRFGFQPASEFDLVHTFDGISQKYLMISWLESANSSKVLGGTVHYCSEFKS